MSSLYLVPYNSLQFFGWSLCLVRVLSSFVSTKSVAGAYASAGQFVCLLHVVAFVEVVHGALGIVLSGVLFLLLQWGGRLQFLLAILRRIPEVQELPSVFITFVAWCCSDVIRYAHYTLNILKSCPPWVTYIRYTAFIVLYPLGFAPGERFIAGVPFLVVQTLPASVQTSASEARKAPRGERKAKVISMSEQKDWKQRHISRRGGVESFSV